MKFTKGLKRGLLMLLMGATVITSLAGVANAAPYDWRAISRNGDDTADVSVGSPSATVDKYAVFGQRKSGEGSSSWYYFDPTWFSIGAANTGDGANNYKVSLDLGAFNPCDLGDLCDQLGSKVPITRTVNGRDLSSNIILGKNDVGLTFADNTSDLNKPISTATQTALNAKFTTPTGTTSQVVLGDGTLGSLPAASKSYEGTTVRNNSFPVFKNATVSSGTAVFNLTADGTSGGTALCPNGVVADSISPTVSDATASYQMSWALSNANKTITVTTNKLTTANILTGILGQSAANGSVVKLSAWCY